MELLNVPIDEFDYAEEALIQCNDIAERTGLSQLSLDDINAEINAIRNTKSSQ